MEEWKLGKDIDVYETLIDDFTFDELIRALSSSEKVIDAAAVRRVAKSVAEQRIEVMDYLIERNMDEIIADAKSRRNS